MLAKCFASLRRSSSLRFALQKCFAPFHPSASLRIAEALGLAWPKCCALLHFVDVLRFALFRYEEVLSFASLCQSAWLRFPKWLRCPSLRFVSPKCFASLRVAEVFRVVSLCRSAWLRFASPKCSAWLRFAEVLRFASPKCSALLRFAELFRFVSATCFASSCRIASVHFAFRRHTVYSRGNIVRHKEPRARPEKRSWVIPLPILVFKQPQTQPKTANEAATTKERTFCEGTKVRKSNVKINSHQSDSDGCEIQLNVQPVHRGGLFTPLR